jgi:hypothetical protein
MGYENIGLGKKKEVQFLKPTQVVIIGFTTQMVEGGKESLILKCKHPDTENEIEIRNIKVEKYGKTMIEGIWLGNDEEGLIPYNSNLGLLLRKAEATTIKDLEGKKIMTDILSVNHPILVVRGY